jgi:DNA repair photolyase
MHAPEQGARSTTDPSIRSICEHTFVRWDNLTIKAEESAALPGYREPAVVRHFDAPEALDTRFYEVRAKSALNRVPEKSRMPFRWTINPYRGCSHACVFCVSGDTPILMADGRTKPLAEVDVGDRIYGTRRVGSFRRYVHTEVLAHWATIKPAFRVTLEDGTEVVASGDHRFLTDRGWKYVLGRRGPGGRPYLTCATKLMGVGQFSAPPDTRREPDYRRGYLCGLIRGDGHVSSSIYHRVDRGPEQRHVFRLALIDIEPLQRADDYLTLAGIGAARYTAPASGRGAQPMAVLQTSARDRVAAVKEIISWPRSASDSWCKGFLAGIYDAEGSHSSDLIRIANTNPVIVDWTTWCLRRLGFKFVVTDAGRVNGLKCIRLLGGLQEKLRFFHTVDPATTRKRSIDGIAIKSKARLRVASVEPLPKSMRLYDITTGTGDFIANGVVSHNCFARPTHTYLGFNAGRDFDKEIVVKVNAPEVLRVELARPSWKGEHIAMGTNTDPYQWVEGRYKLMRGIWEAIRDARNEASILTKSPLLLRDLDLMKEIAEVAPISANLSVPTIDEKAWRASEPHTPNPRARLEAVAELSRAGIPTGVLVAPLMPGINDDPRQVEEILELAAKAGATSVSGITLHLRGEVRGVFMDWLRSYRPDLLDYYEELYARGAYAPRAEQERLSGIVARARSKATAAFGQETRRGFGLMGRGTRGVSRPPAERAGAEAADSQAPSRASPQQTSLF